MKLLILCCMVLSVIGKPIYNPTTLPTSIPIYTHEMDDDTDEVETVINDDDVEDSIESHAIKFTVSDGSGEKEIVIIDDDDVGQKFENKLKKFSTGSATVTLYYLYNETDYLINLCELTTEPVMKTVEYHHEICDVPYLWSPCKILETTEPIYQSMFFGKNIMYQKVCNEFGSIFDY